MTEASPPDPARRGRAAANDEVDSGRECVLQLGEMLDRVGYTLRWWLIGQLFAMLLIGVSTTILLWIFGIPLAIIIGLIVGLLGFIPYLGPILGLVPVVLITATEGFTTVAYVVLAYTGVQMLEGYVANPLIHQGTVHLPPATTVGIQMLMGAVIGVLGIVLATPLAAVLLVVSQFYRADVLEDPDAAPME